MLAWIAGSLFSSSTCRLSKSAPFLPGSYTHGRVYWISIRILLRVGRLSGITMYNKAFLGISENLAYSKGHTFLLQRPQPLTPKDTPERPYPQPYRRRRNPLCCSIRAGSVCLNRLCGEIGEHLPGSGRHDLR